MTLDSSGSSWFGGVVESSRGLVAPFAGRESVTEFYANGGTAAQYTQVMCGYYAAYAARSSDAVRSSSRRSDVVSVSDSAIGVVNADVQHNVVKWAQDTTVGVDPVGMSVSEYDSICASKKQAVESYGEGFCYLYAVRKECMDFVADHCGPDSKFKDILACYDTFEADGFLAMLRVEINGNTGHVAPYSDRGTRFLTLCRALKPGFAPEEFEKRMKKYKLSCAGFASDEAFSLGSGVSSIASAFSALERPVLDLGEHSQAFFERKDLNVYVPDVGAATTRDIRFVKHEVCLGYGGLLCDAPCAGDVELQAPGGFDHGYVYCPRGMGVRVGGRYEQGPCVVFIQPHNRFSVRLDKEYEALWFSVITKDRPRDVVPRRGQDSVLASRVQTAVKNYDEEVFRRLGSVAMGRKYGGVVVLPVYDDRTQGEVVLSRVRSYLRKASEGTKLKSISATIDAFKLIRVMKPGGLVLMSLLYPRVNGIDDVPQDKIEVDGIEDYSIGTMLAVSSKEYDRSQVKLVSAVYNGTVLLVEYSILDKVSGGEMHKCRVEHELTGFQPGNLAFTASAFTPAEC